MSIDDKPGSPQTEQIPALLKSFPDHHLVLTELDFTAKCNLLGRRIGAAAAVLTFIAVYLYGIAEYGVLAGIAFGWLPASFLAWVAIITIAPLSTSLIRKVIAFSNYLSSLIQAQKSAHT